MKTRTQYAIRALYDLAFHRRGQAALAKEIAGRQNIPLRYLEQILQDLRKAGLVEARRGPRGGYALARPPEEVTLADALRAARGPLEAMFALDGNGHANGHGNGAGANGVGAAKVRRAAGRRPVAAVGVEVAADLDVDVPALVWHEVTARLVEVLEGVTLQDLVVRADAAGVKRAVAAATMYFI